MVHMAYEENNLVGPRAEDRDERAVRDVALDGRPIYEAFLSDPDALVTSKEDVESAKNAFEIAKTKHPELIEKCQRMPIEECIKEFSSLEEAA